jgi:CDP-diacylglycerol--inositol 3-phosphatidyltransferase
MFYWPNLIGYGRIVFAYLAFSVCFSDFQLAVIYYLVSQGLDAVDGTVARALGQSSKFGAVLDMLTDRMTTGVLYVVLALLYREQWGFYAFLLVLDITSHWMQMYSTLTRGNQSHKDNTNFLLNFYYKFPYALLFFCVGDQLWIVAQYAMHFTAAQGGAAHERLQLISTCSFPVFLFKQLMNVVQLYDSIDSLNEFDKPRAKKQGKMQSKNKKQSKKAPKKRSRKKSQKKQSQK